MPLIWSILAFALVFCLINLLLGVGVIRRLREHTTLLLQLTVPQNPTSVSIGDLPDDFAATSVDGSPVTPKSLSGPALIGFFTPGCAPCREQIGPFVDGAIAMRATGASVLAVVCGADESIAHDYVGNLGDVAVAVVERPKGAVASAFGVSGFPTFILLGPDGAVTAANHSLARLPQVVS